MVRLCLLVAFVVFLPTCTQEQQNRISRSIQNWTGANGVLDVLGGDKVLYRFIGIDKLSTASSTSGQAIARPYRFGYGVYDLNQNYLHDENERKLYFEISDYATNYVFYENPVKVTP
ncbi:MAG: hypothetical protein OYH77_08265 [Pseudomonadota bacterium]|nr:hypothetical protein [Pseudomonadota bacterium]